MGPGLYVGGDASLTCTGCTLSANEFSGAAIQAGGALTLRESLVEGSLDDANMGGGVGVFVSDHGVQFGYEPPSLVLQETTILDNTMGALYLEGAGNFQVTDNELSGGSGISAHPGTWPHGDSVFVIAGQDASTAWDEDGQVGLLIRDNVLSDSAGAGIFLDGATATLSGNTYRDNDVDLVWQACADLSAPEGLDEEALESSELCPRYDYYTTQLNPRTYLDEATAGY
ncbi:MAG: right-handed parallel beta-helix repeat-containing protein [Myxococcota bacterium]|nr:right-handed parallel beta-helix repeat-containing protein [Myxococcota bacterium]